MSYLNVDMNYLKNHLYYLVLFYYHVIFSFETRKSSLVSANDCDLLYTVKHGYTVTVQHSFWPQ